MSSIGSVAVSREGPASGAPPAPVATLAVRARAALDVALSRVALASVVEATPHLGRPPAASFVAAVLAGSLSRDIVSSSAWTLATFGALARCSRRVVSSLVRDLAARGLVTTLGGVRARGLVLTVEGRDVLDRAPDDPAVVRTGGVTPASVEEAVRSGLVDALRTYRKERARLESAPEWRVLDEAALREVACRRPADVPALLAVPGIGPAKAARYGPDLLGIVAAHPARPSET